MADLNLKDPKVLGGMAVIAVLLFTARRQASRHHAAEHAGRRRAAGLGFFGPWKKKKARTSARQDADDLAREGQRLATRGRCDEAAPLLRAAGEVSDSVVVDYARTIYGQHCDRPALSGARGRRRRGHGLGDGGFYHEQPDYWDKPACWRRAYDNARAARAPKSGARAAADAACVR